MTDCVLIIAAYNEQARIADCLDAVLRSPLPLSFHWRQWILIDDASADATVAVMTAWRDSHARSPVDIVRNPERLGKAVGIDRIHRRLIDEGWSGDVVVILDADVLVEAVTLTELLEPLSADPAMTVVTGIGWPDQRTWGRRASAFQLLLTAGLTRTLGPDRVRAEGRLTAYRLGPFDEMTWCPGYVHEDTQLAAFALRKGLRGHSSTRARVMVTPARGYRDFYKQTYRCYAAHRALAAAGGPEPARAGAQQIGVAVASAARQDPIGAAAYLVARLVLVVRHRIAPEAFTDTWDQAQSTKSIRPGPGDGRRRNQAGRRRNQARMVLGSVRTIRNWPVCLLRMAAGRYGRRGGDLRVVTRSGLTVWCPSSPMAYLPIFEVLVRDDYRLDGLETAGPLNVLDIGAHVGTFALQVTHRFPGSTVSCYEPSPDTARYLNQNIDANRLGHRIHLHAAAVGAECGEAMLYEDGPASCINSLEPVAGWPARPVEVFSFTAAVAEAGGQVDLLKLDCEGGEYQIVFDSPADAWTQVGRVIVEYHPVAGRSSSQLLDRLDDLGFELLWHQPGPPGQGLAGFRRRRSSPPAPTTSANPAAIAADTSSAAWAVDSGS